MQNIILTGFMGVGKSATGKLVAEKLSRQFVDMDTMIEARAGKPVARIFEEQGEGAFRTLEATVCQELAKQANLVIATGGGALVDVDNRTAMTATGCVICLDASADAIYARISHDNARPLLAVPDPRQRIAALLNLREPAYAMIPYHINTTWASLDRVVGEVTKLVNINRTPVHFPGGSYDIHIGTGILAQVGHILRAQDVAKGTRVAVVSNSVVAPLYAALVMDALTQAGLSPSLCIVPDGEQHKTLDTVRELYDQFLAAGLDRSGVVLSLGGGVTGDMAGFAAATFMRGVRFVQVPTTLLSMTDASVGGKTGVDLPEGKNLVGAFKQPLFVLIDTAVLETLPEAEVRSGMAELIKHGFIAAPDLVDGLCRASPDLSSITPAVLGRSIQVKIDVVQQDPFENGRRAVLNLGHTTAHALERLSHFSLRHGEAVSIGIVVAARIASTHAGVAVSLGDEIASLLARWGLPTHIPDYAASDILHAMAHDKKKQGKTLRWVLPMSIGDVRIFSDVPERIVRQALIDSGAKDL